MHRPGYALIAVLIVVVVLSLAAYRFADAMTSEYQVAVRTTEAAQVKSHAASGVHAAMGMLSDPETLNGLLGGNPSDNPLFSNQPVGPQDGHRGGGRYAAINVADTYSGTGESRYQVKYGAADEAAKLNLNAAIQLDPTGQMLHDALMKLPNMTEEIADAIVDWLDADDTERANGAESSYYSGLPQPYRPKNGPLNSLDELLLVRGVTWQLLYGNDRNRNGKLDPGEEDGNDFNRGWSEFLTIYGRELNVDSAGNQRTNLNDSAADPKTLSDTLTAGLGQEMSDYLMAAKFYGTTQITPVVYMTSVRLTPASSGTTTTTTTRTTVTLEMTATVDAKSGSGGQSGGQNQPKTITGGAGELRTAVQGSIDAGSPATKQVKTVLGLYNTKVTLPKPANSPPDAPTVEINSPLNDPTKLKDLLPKLLDLTTTRTTFEIVPRLNATTAPPEVLLGLPGLTQPEVDAMMAVRQTLNPTDPATTTGAWLVTAAGLSPTKFDAIEKYVTGRTSTYRLQSVGYFGTGGPAARVEAVIDTNQGHPRILYYRDLTDLGKGFDLPR